MSSLVKPSMRHWLVAGVALMAFIGFGACSSKETTADKTQASPSSYEASSAPAESAPAVSEPAPKSKKKGYRMEDYEK